MTTRAPRPRLWPPWRRADAVSWGTAHAPLKPVRFRSIATRLAVTLLAVSAVALLVAGGGFLAFGVLHERTQDHAEAAERATLGARLVAQALTAGDMEQAARTLDALRADAEVEGVAVFDTSGQPMALGPDSLARPDPSRPLPEGVLAVERPVQLTGGPVLGTLVLHTRRTPLRQQAYPFLLLAAGVLAGSLLVAYGVSQRLRAAIVQPIAHLTDTVRAVTAYRAYDVRTRVRPGDELGELARCLNEMIGQLQLREAQIAQQRARLEEAVAQRTQQIAEAHDALAEAHDAIAHERDRAEAHSRLKTELMMNMSHELRTPLAAILGFSSLLREAAEGDTVEFVDLVTHNANRLLNTLSAVLDLADLEAGAVAVQPMPQDLRPYVEGVVEQLRAEADLRGLWLFVETPEAPVVAVVDGPLVTSALRHVVANAVKFTLEGGVTVRLRLFPDWAVVEVHDTGIGIPEGERERIFEPFVQLSTGEARSHEGNGIGLAVARQSARLLGGNVVVADPPGEGSVFLIELPRPGTLAEPRPSVGALHPALLTGPVSVAPVERGRAA